MAFSNDKYEQTWQDAQRYCLEDRDKFPSSLQSITNAEMDSEREFSRLHWTGLSRRFTVVKTSRYHTG